MECDEGGDCRFVGCLGCVHDVEEVEFVKALTLHGCPGSTGACR